MLVDAHCNASEHANQLRIRSVLAELNYRTRGCISGKYLSTFDKNAALAC